MASLQVPIKLETRLCEVRGELGYFHLWEQYSKPTPDGIRSQVCGIVEFSGKVRRVEPHIIKFRDEKSAMLYMMNEDRKKEKENG